MNVSKIYNANVYVGPTLSQLGQASEITLPDIAVATEEHSALGMIGKVLLPTGLEAMSFGIKWNGFYADVLAKAANPFIALQFQVRANVQTFGAAGLASEEALKISLTGRFTKWPLGTLTSKTANESASELTATYLKLALGTRELVEIDVIENVWVVDGIDVLATYRENLGG